MVPVVPYCAVLKPFLAKLKVTVLPNLRQSLHSRYARADRVSASRLAILVIYIFIEVRSMHAVR